MTWSVKLAAALAATLALGTLAGCVTYERPADLRPVNVAELRQKAEEMREDRTLRIMDRKWSGFHVRPDDRFVWTGQGTRVVITRTRVSRVQDNVICAAPNPQTSWTGGCFGLFEDREGRIFAEIEFGNGVRRGFFVLEDPLLIDGVPYLKRGI